MKKEDQIKRVLDSKNITSRSESFSRWYQDVINAADLAERGPVYGTMVIKPYGYAIWEKIQKILDEKFKKLGVKNVYFPSLIPQRLLAKELEHVEGFSPEVAAVTYAGGKKLQEPFIIRPTSETIIYNSFKHWIYSWRDLPILINQWVNVVRWEMRPRLFLRTSEFLWQEGHTAHSTAEEADDFSRKILSIYEWFAREVMAIPVIVGEKTNTEKFAGAFKTYSVEAMMQDGKSLQFATSHNLGQNFSKAFNISFFNRKNEAVFVYQTSWGLSTRTIGGIIMIHGDDTGLVLPPKIAPIEIIIIPIWREADPKEKIISKSKEILEILKKNGMAGEIDFRDIRPGEKFYEWERKGVPIRIEIGPRDLKNKTITIVRRDTKERAIYQESHLIKITKETLEKIQTNLLLKATSFRDSNIIKVDSWKDFSEGIKKNKFVLAHWDNNPKTEQKIKEKTKATIRCIPFPIIEEDGRCIYTGNPSTKRVLFAKSY